MAISLEAYGIDKLSVSDRLALIELIWDSLRENVEFELIPDWHRQIIADRYAEAVANPGQGRPWQEVLAKYEPQP